MGILPVNALVAADKYIIPTTPEHLSLEGLVNFTEAVARVKAGIGAKCSLLGIVLTKVDRRTSAAKEMMAMIKEQYQNTVFNSVIHQKVKLSEAPSFGKSIFQYDWNSIGATCYQDLCKEIILKLKKEQFMAKSSKSRIGKNPLQKSANDSVFEKSDAKQEASNAPKNRGRPVQHEEKWVKSTVVLFSSQIAWLDHLAADIRMKTGAALARAELIRAMIGAIQEKGIDLTQVTSEEEAREKIKARIK